MSASPLRPLLPLKRWRKCDDLAANKEVLDIIDIVRACLLLALSKLIAVSNYVIAYTPKAYHDHVCGKRVRSVLIRSELSKSRRIGI